MDIYGRRGCAEVTGRRKEKNGGDRNNKKTDGRRRGEVRVCTYGPQTEIKRWGVMEHGKMMRRAFLWWT